MPRPSDKVATTVAVKDPAYKRFARKLCCGGKGGRGRSTVRKGHATSAAASAAGGRSSKCWAAVWKRRPRWSCGRFCGSKRLVAAGRPAATVPTDTAAPGFRRRQWWRRWPCSSCCCCRCLGKRNKHAKLATSISSDIGALGISPPNLPPPPSANTFCGKLKRRLCCCCGPCAVPKFIRRLCCCCCCCVGSGAVAENTQSSEKRRLSLFKCTGCCTVCSNRIE